MRKHSLILTRTIIQLTGPNALCTNYCVPAFINMSIVRTKSSSQIAQYTSQAIIQDSQPLEIYDSLPLAFFCSGIKNEAVNGASP